MVGIWGCKDQCPLWDSLKMLKDPFGPLMVMIGSVFSGIITQYIEVSHVFRTNCFILKPPQNLNNVNLHNSLSSFQNIDFEKTAWNFSYPFSIFCLPIKNKNKPSANKMMYSKLKNILVGCYRLNFCGCFGHVWCKRDHTSNVIMKAYWFLFLSSLKTVFFKKTCYLPSTTYPLLEGFQAPAVCWREGIPPFQEKYSL